MAYCTNDDLVARKPKILTLGVTDWADVIAKADADINRAIEAGWYRAEAEHLGVDWRSTQFDPDDLLSADTQLKDLGVFLTLHYAYEYLSKDTPEPDSFERLSDRYKRFFQDELRLVLNAGLDYDWDGSGDLAYTEKDRPVRRRLKRC